MPVSANTLFHFTSQKSLRDILLSSKFFPSFSEEHFENVVPKKLDSHSILYVPLVSFCDLTIIQLARDSKHTKYYDKYGVGLKKEWGNKNKISPVTYVHKNSPSANKIFTLYNLADEATKDSTSKLFDDLFFIKRHMTDSFKYLKPYKGRWLKRKKYSQAITYYNEREWRFCPSMDDFEVLTRTELIALSNNNLKKELEGRNKGLREFSFVKFTPDDIKYIIVNKEHEVENFAKWLRGKFSNEAQSVLIPKLISFEKIENDF